MARRRARCYPRLPGGDAAATRAGRLARPACATNRCVWWWAAACTARPRRGEGDAGGAPLAARLRVVDAQGISQSSVVLGSTTGGGAISMNDVVARRRPRGRPGHRRASPLRRLLGRRQGGGDRLRRRGDDRLDAPSGVPRPACRASLPARRQPLPGGAARDRGGHCAALRLERRDGRRRRGRRAGGRRPRRAPSDGWPATTARAWIRRHERPFDLVVAGVPAPKDAASTRHRGRPPTSGSPPVRWWPTAA